MTTDTITAEAAIQAKDEVGVQAPTWRHFLLPNPAAAVDFANRPPAQGRGEASFSVRDDGRTDTFLYF